MEKVLITGGAGFIGSNIADRLIELGYEVIILDNLCTGKKENINSSAKFYEFDVRDKALIDVFKAEKPDVVIHNAAQLSVRISVQDPMYDAEVNVLGGLNVFNCSMQTRVKKVVFASSGGTVYGEQQYFPADEKHSTNPVSPYGVAKLASENYLYYFNREYGLDYIALRYANIYGPRQDPLGEAGVVAIFSNKIIKGASPVINGDGGQTRDYVFVGDAVDANVHAIESSFCGAINIGTAKETNVNELFYILRDISGKSIEEVHGPAKPGEQYRSVLDNGLAKNILGWNPSVPIKEGLKLTYEWFNKNMQI
ncbi:MAG: NAD-dependent epimerase/dehydratase family protein [Actinobacteria bacterium]|nr:NAD-dependent epimerase/dehydratase family protein [Actinomycetota bacterium]